MTAHAYRLVNVFTQGRRSLSGNPLCVFERGQALAAQDMQALALQFNLSETTFILPSERASARVRIFTPRYEMPFAGHPTLGTAHVCRSLGLGGERLTLEMAAGVIAVRALDDRWTLQANAPSWREVAEPRALLAAMLGVAERDLAERPLWVNAGREQLIVPLASEAAVRRVNVQAGLLAQLKSTDGQSMVYVFAAAGNGTLARFFFPVGNSVREDPATGSATANLGGWCLAMGRALPCEFDLSQGEYTGRHSALRLQVDAERRIFVSGEVIEIGRGTVNL
ncbi:MAG TPA: PhzF family phenazine biosynthesis protein [Steroidobacteraceae bacterium]|jgi:PhzF family phenazine biosynthesis protein|nr:PhzF family phenazine biosynthesis protein [Steroidobacteraceae bacterium]